MPRNWKTQFAVIYAGQAFSLLGSAVVQFAVIWRLTIQTESAITLTLAAIASFLPGMLIGPFAGVWIDRFNRRTVMIAADGLVAFSSLLLGAAFLLSDTPPLGFIYLILFVRGVGNTFHMPALQAAIPLLVPVEMLSKAGGWGNLVSSATNLLGPMLGALLMGLLPMAGIMLVDIGGALFAIICLLFVKIPDLSHTDAKPEFLADFKQGFAALRQNKPLMAALLPLTLASVIYMPLGALYPLLVRVHFLGGVWHNGVVELFFAAGLLISSLVMGLWGGLRRRFLMVSLAIGLLGAAAMLGGALPPGGFMIFVVCSFLMGFSGTFFNVPLMAYIQESTPPEVLGKVFSLVFTVMTLAMPVGLLLAGPVTELIGPDKWFFWSGLVMLGTALLCRVLTRPYDRQTMLPKASSGNS